MPFIGMYQHAIMHVLIIYKLIFVFKSGPMLIIATTIPCLPNSLCNNDHPFITINLVFCVSVLQYNHYVSMHHALLIKICAHI